VPLPEPFGQMFGYWLSDKGKLMRSGIDNKVMSRKLRTPMQPGSLMPRQSSWTSRRCLHY
jgi:hypothetical protein